jgi:uncharacterized protein
MKTTVIHHSADYDGIFCREIARKFLPDAELIGWDFGDPPRLLPDGKIYILDLPVDRVFGYDFTKGHPADMDEVKKSLVWIDHHKSAIESHPKSIPGYRIDGVAACRLAWQWFIAHAGTQTWPHPATGFPEKQDFIDRKVVEPLAVRLAGEYDIWDKRDPDAELFQHGLRSQELDEDDWKAMLSMLSRDESATVQVLLASGEAVQYAKTKENESVIKELGFTFQWEGLTFLCCNAARYNSHLFTAGLKPEHDACFGFKWSGKDWSVSLYHAPGKEHNDLSLIAVKHGGGGHRGACGFRATKLPFLP